MIMRPAELGEPERWPPHFFRASLLGTTLTPVPISYVVLSVAGPGEKGSPLKAILRESFFFF
jgi:hypothetical protein